MTVDSAIRRFRTRQAEQFTTTATVTRRVGEPEFDPDTGAVTETAETVYTGPCKIRPDTIRSTGEADTGQTSVSLPDYNGKFPVDTDIQRGDTVTVTASVYDAGMVGRSFTVTMAQSDEWQISRVALLEEVVVPLLNP